MKKIRKTICDLMVLLSNKQPHGYYSFNNDKYTISFEQIDNDECHLTLYFRPSGFPAYIARTSTNDPLGAFVVWGKKISNYSIQFTELILYESNNAVFQTVTRDKIFKYLQHIKGLVKFADELTLRLL